MGECAGDDPQRNRTRHDSYECHPAAEPHQCTELKVDWSALLTNPGIGTKSSRGPSDWPAPIAYPMKLCSSDPCEALVGTIT